MEIGKTLKAYRTAAKLTQEKAADLIGVSKNTIQNWERDKTIPNITYMNKIAEIYGINLSDIQQEEEKKPAHNKDFPDFLIDEEIQKKIDNCKLTKEEQEFLTCLDWYCGIYHHWSNQKWESFAKLDAYGRPYANLHELFQLDKLPVDIFKKFTALKVKQYYDDILAKARNCPDLLKAMINFGVREKRPFDIKYCAYEVIYSFFKTLYFTPGHHKCDKPTVDLYDLATLVEELEHEDKLFATAIHGEKPTLTPFGKRFFVVNEGDIAFKFPTLKTIEIYNTQDGSKTLYKCRLTARGKKFIPWFRGSHSLPF